MRLFRLFFIAVFAALACKAPAAPLLPPAPTTPFYRAGPVLVCVGDSECQQGTVSNPAGSTYYSSLYQIGTYANSILGWMNVVSGSAFTLDFINQAYPGNINGLKYARILTQGSGCPASTVVTLTPAAPTGSPANTPATLSFTTTAAGLTPPAGTTIYETVGANQGSGYLVSPVFTLSQTCTVPPVLGYAFTGTGTWAVNGETTINWLARIQAEVCAARPDWALDIIGTNDITQGVAEATINANTLAGLRAEEACGIRPVLFDIMPRINGVGGWTQIMDKTRLRINAWRRNLAMLTQSGVIASTTGLSTYPGLPMPVLYVDVDHFWSNATNTCASSCAVGAFVGDPLLPYTIDGLHQSPIGALTEALAAWQQIQTFVHSPITYVPNSQNDVYDGTNNPAGNLIGTNGMFLGTSGSVTAPCTTSSAMSNNWNLTESGNAAMSCVATLETTRTDGLQGQRQVITISDTGGTVSDQITLALYQNFTSSLSTGDQIYFEGDLDLSNLNQVENVGCNLNEVNTVNQTLTMTFAGSTNGYNSTYPSLSSATLAKWNEARSLPDWQTTGAGSFRMHFRSPPLTVQAGDTNWTTQCLVYLNGSTGTATATIKAGNFAVRKINAN